MKILLLLTLFFSSILSAEEITLSFSNGWIVKLEDTNFVNYDHFEERKKVRVHRNHTLLSFNGSAGKSKVKSKGRDYSVSINGVFKHTIERYTHRGDLSVIEFNASSREFVDKELKVFRNDNILFETKKKPFSGMGEIKQALLSTLNRKDMYKAIRIVQDENFSENNSKKEIEVTLISMSVDGVNLERKKSRVDVFLDIFNFD